MVANNEKALNTGTIKSKKALEKSANPAPEINGRRNPNNPQASSAYLEKTHTHAHPPRDNAPIKSGRGHQSEFNLEYPNQQKSKNFATTKSQRATPQGQPRNLTQNQAPIESKKTKKSKDRLQMETEMLESKRRDEKAIACKNDSHGRGCKHEGSNNKINLCDEETKKI